MSKIVLDGENSREVKMLMEYREYWLENIKWLKKNLKREVSRGRTPESGDDGHLYDEDGTALPYRLEDYSTSHGEIVEEIALLIEEHSGVSFWNTYDQFFMAVVEEWTFTVEDAGLLERAYGCLFHIEAAITRMMDIFDVL